MAGETSRANGRRSSGPRTAFGKASARRNALRHGLAAKTLASATPTPRTLALALELAQPFPLLPAVLRAALDLAMAEEMLAAVCRERQRVLRREIDKAQVHGTIRSGLDASVSLLTERKDGAGRPGDLEALAAGLELVQAIALSSIRRSPRPAELQAWVDGASELQRLERYHRRAFGRRERALWTLRKALAAAERGNAGWPDPDLVKRLQQDVALPVGDIGTAAARKASASGRAHP